MTKCVGVTSGRARELRLGDWQHVIAHEGWDGAVAVCEGAHRRDHARCGGGAAGSYQRHQPVRQSESGLAVADPRLGLVRKFLPAVADIDAETLQTEEHGCGVLHIDVDVR